MSQEGKDAGLGGALSGQVNNDSYWNKNKGKSKQEVLKKITVFFGILFIFLALLLTSKFPDKWSNKNSDKATATDAVVETVSDAE